MRRKTYVAMVGGVPVAVGFSPRAAARAAAAALGRIYRSSDGQVEVEFEVVEVSDCPPAGVSRGDVVARLAADDEMSDEWRREIAAWSDGRFRSLVASVEAGNHDYREGWEDCGVASVFELWLILEESMRRGLPPVRLGRARPVVVQ